MLVIHQVERIEAIVCPLSSGGCIGIAKTMQEQWGIRNQKILVSDSREYPSHP